MQMGEPNYLNWTVEQVKNATLEELRQNEYLWHAYERGWCDWFTSYVNTMLMQSETRHVMPGNILPGQQQMFDGNDEEDVWDLYVRAQLEEAELARVGVDDEELMAIQRSMDHVRFWEDFTAPKKSDDNDKSASN